MYIKQVIKVWKSYLQIRSQHCATQDTADGYGNPTASTQLERKGKGNTLVWFWKNNIYVCKFALQLFLNIIIHLYCIYCHLLPLEISVIEFLR